MKEVEANMPNMRSVVKEIESTMKFGGINPNVESTSTSESYDGVKMGTIIYTLMRVTLCIIVHISVQIYTKPSNTFVI